MRFNTRASYNRRAHTSFERLAKLCALNANASSGGPLSEHSEHDRNHTVQTDGEVCAHDNMVSQRSHKYVRTPSEGF
jgi:hypothetical protein